MTRIAQPAALDWQDGQPVSTTYQDVYFSVAGGLDETRHVFIKHNQLPERFAALPAAGSFCIAETGFGTGLNFLLTWQVFLQTAPADARLNFVSTEKHPLSAEDMQRALAMWPQLQAQSSQLLAQYDALAPGWHRFVLENGRIILTLLIGDALETLPQLHAQVDAWFLDGFSPSKNPEMWQPELFQQMARLGHHGTTFATFTCAGAVRRGLQAAGFAVSKVPGHGIKREMSCGQLVQLPEHGWQAPWLQQPSSHSGERSAIVVGAGIAGASAAHSLALRGWAVTVIDRHHSPACEASGNPQGILYTKLSAHLTPLTRLVLSGYAYSLRTLEQHLADDGISWQRCGVLQLADSEDELKRQQGLAALGLPADILQAVDAQAASELAGLPLSQSGLYFPQGGWLNPPSLVGKLLDHPNISLRLGKAITELSQNHEDDSWLAMHHDEALAIGSIVVLAAANDTLAFDATAHLPLKRIRGQISEVAATAASSQLKTVLCGEGYIAPARHDRHTLGATFKFDHSDLQTHPAEHRENLDMLSRMAPALAAGLSNDEAACQGRAAERCTSPDYLPLLGGIARRQQFVEHYRDLSRDASLQLDAAMPWIKGLYTSTAHGSRGMVTAPLAGEVLASLLEGEPMPLPTDLLNALSPNRFMLRELVRQKRQKPDKAASAT